MMKLEWSRASAAKLFGEVKVFLPWLLLWCFLYIDSHGIGKQAFGPYGAKILWLLFLLSILLVPWAFNRLSPVKAFLIAPLLAWFATSVSVFAVSVVFFYRSWPSIRPCGWTCNPYFAAAVNPVTMVAAFLAVLLVLLMLIWRHRFLLGLTMDWER
jgi:hypothetical protein